MDLNEATKILANNGYAIDEGIGNFLKKARRSVFGKNKDDEDILAKRRARQEQQAKTHADDEKQREGTLSASDDYTSDVLRYLQDEEEYRAIYEILVKLRKKYGKYIMYSNALTPHRISVSAVYQKNSTSREMAGKYSDRNGGKYASAPVDRKQYNFCKVGEIGLLATDRFNYSDRKGGFDDNDSNAHMKYATSVENAMNSKYTETDDIKEWAVEINDIVNEIVNSKSKNAANDWEQNIDQNESAKFNKGENNMDLNEAKQILKRNGYICEGFMDKLKLKKDKFFGQSKYNEDLAAELQDVSITDYSKILQVLADYGLEDELKKAGNWNDFDPDEPGEFWACLQGALGWKVSAFSSGNGDGSWVNINGKKCKSAYQAYVAMQNGKYEG